LRFDDAWFRKIKMSAVPVQKYLLDFFDPKDALKFFDIGSCDGKDSIAYSMQFPNATIYAFEPVDSNYREILKNIKTSGSTKIIPLNLAMGKQKGVLPLYLSSTDVNQLPSGTGSAQAHEFGNKSSSLLEPLLVKKYYPWLNFEKKIEVKVETIADFCESLQIEAIDFIHLDVQGAEQMVLEGAGDFIYKIKFIWLEVSKVSYYKSQPVASDIFKFMRSKGFMLLNDQLNYPHGDQLYVNKKYYLRRKGRLSYLLNKLHFFKLG
jgi:FkbM family methyltransferase